MWDYIRDKLWTYQDTFLNNEVSTIIKESQKFQKQLFLCVWSQCKAVICGMIGSVERSNYLGGWKMHVNARVHWTLNAHRKHHDWKTTIERHVWKVRLAFISSQARLNVIRTQWPCACEVNPTSNSKGHLNPPSGCSFFHKSQFLFRIAFPIPFEECVPYHWTLWLELRFSKVRVRQRRV